jgi:hypothetical protein
MDPRRPKPFLTLRCLIVLQLTKARRRLDQVWSKKGEKRLKGLTAIKQEGTERRPEARLYWIIIILLIKQLPVTFASDLIKSQWETDLILLVFTTPRRRSNLGEFRAFLPFFFVPCNRSPYKLIKQRERINQTLLDNCSSSKLVNCTLKFPGDTQARFVPISSRECVSQRSWNKVELQSRPERGGYFQNRN